MSSRTASKNRKQKIVPNSDQRQFEAIEEKVEDRVGVYNAMIVDAAIERDNEGKLKYVLVLQGEQWRCMDVFDLYDPRVFLALMEVTGQNSFRNIIGKNVRCVLNGVGQDIYQIGHIIEDKWTDLRQFSMREEPIGEEPQEETKENEKPAEEIMPS